LEMRLWTSLSRMEHKAMRAPVQATCLLTTLPVGCNSEKSNTNKSHKLSREKQENIDQVGIDINGVGGIISGRTR
jgi:hypothetical protein